MSGNGRPLTALDTPGRVAARRRCRNSKQAKDLISQGWPPRDAWGHAPPRHQGLDEARLEKV